MASTKPKKEMNMEEALWKAAGKLRGSVEPAEYKHIVLNLFFLKFASDKLEARRQELRAEGKEQYLDFAEFYTMKNVFFLPAESRWSYIMENAKQDDIALRIDTALYTVEKSNPALKGALPDNYYSRLHIDTAKLASLLDEINRINTDDKEQDIIGRVYEYFLGKFALAEGKGKGEFYTPKGYWTEAVVFTTSINSFGPTEISYLENRFCHLALNANRYTVKNENDPTPGHITEEKESELEEFIEYAKIVMGTLSHKLFEPLLQFPMQLSLSDGDAVDGSPEFLITRSGANAKAKLTHEGIVVLAGSIIRKEIVPSCPEYAKTVREKNKDNISDEGYIQIDLLFKTPSGASAFVLGAPTNGNIEWRTADGMVLKDFESSVLEKA